VDKKSIKVVDQEILYMRFLLSIRKILDFHHLYVIRLKRQEWSKLLRLTGNKNARMVFIRCIVLKMENSMVDNHERSVEAMLLGF